MSRSRSRKAKRAFDKLGWADQRRIAAARDAQATRKASTPKPKPQWVAVVESSGHQTIGGTRRSARVSGLTKPQRQMNRQIRRDRPAVANPHTDKVRQVRADGREELLAGTPYKPLTLPVGTMLRSSLLPEYRKPRVERPKPSPYTR